MSSTDFNKLLPVLHALEEMDWAERSFIVKLANNINLQVDIVVDYDKLEELEAQHDKYLESRQINNILRCATPLDEVSDDLFAKLAKDPRFEYLLVERFKRAGIDLNEHENILDRWVDRDNRDAVVTTPSGIPSHGEDAGIPIDETGDSQPEISAQSADPAGNPVTLIGAEPVTDADKTTTSADQNHRSGRNSGKK